MAFGEGTSQLDREEARAFFPREIIFSALIVTIACKLFLLVSFQERSRWPSYVIVKLLKLQFDGMTKCQDALLSSWWFPFWLIIINLSSSGYEEEIWVSAANLRRGAYSLGSWASMATGLSRNCCSAAAEMSPRCSWLIALLCSMNMQE